MAFEFVSLGDAKDANGVRMTVIDGIPSPWSEAAKGLLHMIKCDWNAVRHKPGDRELRSWTSCDNAPALVNGTDRTRSGWVDILLFCEKRSSEGSLLPAEPHKRAMAIGLSHEIMGEEGLCWLRRLQLVHGGMQLEGPAREHAEYIGARYDYQSEKIETGHLRIIQLLNMFSEILEEQMREGSFYYFGSSPTALDVYSAVSMALFAPLPEALCAMNPATRMAFSALDDATRTALNPLLLQHRDLMYERHLALPLSL